MLFMYLHTVIYRNKPSVSNWERLKVKVAHKTGQYFISSVVSKNQIKEEQIVALGGHNLGLWTMITVHNILLMILKYHQLRVCSIT